MKRTCGALLLLGCLSCASVKTDQFINPHSAREALEIAMTVNRIYPFTDTSFTVIRSKLEKDSFVLTAQFPESNPVYIGYDNARYSFRRSGGNCQFKILLIVHQDSVLASDLAVSGSSNYVALVGTVLSESIVGNALPPEYLYCLRFRFINAALYRSFTTRLADSLGAVVQVTIPDSLKDAYDLLLNPLNDLMYGDMCGYGGAPPDGRIAIERLKRSQRYDLIENVLRGGNPEGRIYALEAILERGEADLALVERNRSSIIQVMSLPFDISICEGCFISCQPPTRINKIRVLLGRYDF